MNAVINLRDKLTKFADYWAPKVVAQMNDYQFKLVKIQGEFVGTDTPTRMKFSLCWTAR